MIIYWGCFGDLMMTIPLITYLRKGFPKSRIDYLVQAAQGSHRFFEHGGRALENNPGLNKIIKFKNYCLLQVLKEAPYDLALDLCQNETGELLSYLSGAEEKLFGHFRVLPPYFSYARRQTDGKWSKERHIEIKKGANRVEQFLALSRALGVKTHGKVVPRVYLTREEKDFGRIFFKKLNRKNKLIVGMHPGGRLPRRLWSPRNYSLLADRLIQELGVQVVVFYGPREEKNARKVCRYSRHKLKTVFQKDIRKYMALLPQCALFISSDGGPLHMALAQKVPSLGLLNNKYTQPFWYSCYHAKIASFFLFKENKLAADNKVVDQVFKKAKQVLRNERDRV